jgi:mRNA interferase MazF
MTQVRRSDIVRVDLGGRDDADARGHETYKKRPAVVVQNDLGNRNSATTIVAPVVDGFTGYPFQVNLPASTAGLRKDSHAELDQIRTVDIDERILDTLGRVDARKTSELDRAIEVSLGL